MRIAVRLIADTSQIVFEPQARLHQRAQEFCLRPLCLSSFCSSDLGDVGDHDDRIRVIRSSMARHVFPDYVSGSSPIKKDRGAGLFKLVDFA
jgi:hypothetical protein